MAQVVIPDTSPLDLLAALRGRVVDSVRGYPDVLDLTVKDRCGDEWGFATFDSEWSPTDPEAFLGKTVTRVDLNVPTGELSIGFSDRSVLTVVPTPGVEDSDLENWQIFTPDGFVLNYGPGRRWQLKRASDAV